MSNSMRWCITAGVLLLLCHVGIPPAHAQLAGAIFTTDSASGETNQNLFESKEDVYLNGGPRRPGSAGLPDGSYYCRVTSPNGLLLGTSIGAGNPTPIHVTGGVFDEVYLLWDILVKPDLTPGYDDTPNNGGEYKVWISQVSDFTGPTSKTDNFKVNDGATLTIRAWKFYDADGDGEWDLQEPPIPDWHIVLYLVTAGGRLQIACGLTDMAGRVEFVVRPETGDTYVVAETLIDPFLPSTPLEVAVDPQAVEDPVDVEFGNFCLEPVLGLGRTPGFWQACNSRKGKGTVGCDLLGKCDPAWRTELNGLCLVWPDNTPFEVPGGESFEAAFAAFAGWIVGIGADGNMAYILSKQLAATALNALCGPMSAMPLWVEGPDGVLLSMDAFLAAANEVLCSGDRDTQEDWKDLLDSINNNLTPVYRICPVPPTFEPVQCP